MTIKLFDVEKQLAFYGAYHTNKVNVRIHEVCVPILIWTFQITLASLPTPDFFPNYEHAFTQFLVFKFNWATLQALVYFSYYFALFPTGALLYAPQSILSTLTATAVATNFDLLKSSLGLHVVCWLAQFYGHGVHEGRAPALLDNLIGAVVLAPFFVHLELLFEAGFFSDLHTKMKNNIGKLVMEFRQASKERETKHA